MGVNLELYPYSKPSWPAAPKLGRILHPDRRGIQIPNSPLHGLLRDISKPIPKKVAFISHQLKGYGWAMQNDNYGERLRYVTAGAAVRAILKADPDFYAGIVHHGTEKQLRRIVSRLEKLPKTTPIILFWT